MPGNPAKTRSAAAVGAWIDAACSVFKAAAGFAFGSYALVADAAHSFTDLVTDLAVVFGAKYWSAPPDDSHPYGHGKIEALVVLFMSAALFVAAVSICCAAFGENGAAPCAFAGTVAFSAALVKFGLAVWTFRAAVSAKSQALKANAWHHMSDALSSVPVAAAVFMSSACPRLVWLDSAAAVLVAAIVVKTAWSFAKSAALELVDADVPGVSASVASIASRAPGVMGVHKVRVRKYGGSFHADLHMQVDPGLSVEDGHTAAHAVRDMIVSECPDVMDVVVHIEPFETGNL